MIRIRVKKSVLINKLVDLGNIYHASLVELQKKRLQFVESLVGHRVGFLRRKLVDHVAVVEWLINRNSRSYNDKLREEELYEKAIRNIEKMLVYIPKGDGATVDVYGEWYLDMCDSIERHEKYSRSLKERATVYEAEDEGSSPSESTS